MLAYINGRGGGLRQASTQSLEDDSSEDNVSVHSSSEDDTKYDLASKDEEIELLSTELSTTLELLAESQAKCKQLKRELDQLSKKKNTNNGSRAKSPKKYRSKSTQVVVSDIDSMLSDEMSLRDNVTCHDILFYGLCIVGFGDNRQNVRFELNENRFKGFFGVEPRTVKDLLTTLKEEFPDELIFKQVMMAMNWLKACKCLWVL